jgi:ComF family protein
MSATALLRPVRRYVLNTLLPPACLACDAAVDDAGALCGRCWNELTFLGPPHCACCGHPFEFEISGESLCASCVARRPAYDRARAVLRYDETSRRLLLGFKHADRTHSAPAFGKWLARAGAELVVATDLIAPVPLHRWRLFRRRYNQAALLAQALGRETGLPVAIDLLVRRRPTPSQGRKSRAARIRNVAGAFAVRAGRRDRLDGRRVLLVDDVMTTGATVEECARVLKRNDAARVDVLTLARVVLPR